LSSEWFKVMVLCIVKFNTQWLLYVPAGLALQNSTFCPHSVFMYFAWISEQTAIISLHKKVRVPFCLMLPYIGALVEWY
jgi:hypothetical protein